MTTATPGSAAEAQMTRCVWSLPWALALVLSQSVPAAAQSDAGCAALTLTVVGIPEAASAQCSVRTLGGGDGKGTNEFIKMTGSAAIFVVSHTYVGLRTYVIRRGIKDFIDEITFFEKTEAWGDETESLDFDVRRFDAKIRGDDHRLTCFGFSRYSGHVANSGGYRHHIDGFYCDLVARDIAADRIDELMGSIKYDFE
jgi:hypothetical protein